MAKTDPYKVKQVRGPFVDIEPHPQTCDSIADLKRLAKSVDGPTSADLFCGCGGMSLGLEAAGFTSVLGVDFDEKALETYNGLFPGMALRRDLHDPGAIQEIIEILRDVGVDLIAGGPPCQPFSRAGRSRIRELVELGRRDAHDERRDLWQSFVEVIAGVRPRAAIMENVPDLALGDEMRTVRTIVDELEGEGYDVHTRIVSAPDYGIPQHRQRVILVALRDGGEFRWPEPVEQFVTLGLAIKDLPPIEGGWRPVGGAAGYLDYEPDLDNEFVAEMRDGMHADSLGRLYDHITKPVREDDRKIFAQMDSTTKYSDIDEDLKRYRDDIFDDKYKRLDFNQASRTITAHIAKDGYWYIHPDQERTISVREAARLQTFPDRVRFAGGPSNAFRQIGNAVPPRMSRGVGNAVRHAMETKGTGRPTTQRVSKDLARWFNERSALGKIWFEASSPWAVIQAELLFGRSTPSLMNFAWPLVENILSPSDSLENFEQTIGIIAGYQKTPERGQLVQDAAEWYVENDGDHFESAATMAKNPHVSESMARLAELVAVSDTDVPILVVQGPLRIAARYSGRPVDRINKGSDGRLELSRLVGGSVFLRSNQMARDAHLGLLELAELNCTSGIPSCATCPLRSDCSYAQENYDGEGQLFG